MHGGEGGDVQTCACECAWVGVVGVRDGARTPMKEKKKSKKRAQKPRKKRKKPSFLPLVAACGAPLTPLSFCGASQ